MRLDTWKRLEGHHPWGAFENIALELIKVNAERDLCSKRLHLSFLLGVWLTSAPCITNIVLALCSR